MRQNVSSSKSSATPGSRVRHTIQLYTSRWWVRNSSSNASTSPDAKRWSRSITVSTTLTERGDRKLHVSRRQQPSDPVPGYRSAVIREPEPSIWFSDGSSIALAFQRPRLTAPPHSHPARADSVHNNFQLSFADSKPLPAPSRHATSELKGSLAWPPTNKTPLTASTLRNPPAPVPPPAR